MDPRQNALQRSYSMNSTFMMTSERPSLDPDQFKGLHFGDGRHYDLHLDGYTADRDFYVRLAGAGLRVLELGSGTGRIAIPCSENGCRVVGVDLLPDMIEVARAKAAGKKVRIDWICGDFLDAAVPGTHDLILGPFNFFSQFPRPGLDQALAKAARLLSENGRVAFDVFNAGWLERRGFAGSSGTIRYESPDGSGTIELRVTARLKDGWILVAHEYALPTGKRVRDDFRLLALTPAELDAALAANGLRIEAKYGNFSRKAFEPEDAHQIVIARRI